MLQNFHYDGKNKGWDGNEHVTLHKEQHIIIESPVDHGYNSIDNVTKVCYFSKQSEALS